MSSARCHHHSAQTTAGQDMTSACDDQDPTATGLRCRPLQPMTDPRDNPALIRAALLRKALADARQRAALARRLGLTHRRGARPPTPRPRRRADARPARRTTAPVLRWHRRAPPASPARRPHQPPHKSARPTQRGAAPHIQPPGLREPTPGRPSSTRSTPSPSSSQSAKQRPLHASSNTSRTPPSAMLIDSHVTPTRAPTRHSQSRCPGFGPSGSRAQAGGCGPARPSSAALLEDGQAQYRRRS